jgi:general stress protein 26
MISKNDLLELMNESEAVYLATVEGSIPRIRALVNLRRSDLYPGPSRFCRDQGFTVYLSTSADTGKVEEVLAHPLASVYYCIPRQFHGITITGAVEILTDPNLRKTLWDEAWRVYFPMGDSDPNYVVLRIKPAEAEGWWGREKFRLTLEDLS